MYITHFPLPQKRSEFLHTCNRIIDQMDHQQQQQQQVPHVLVFPLPIQGHINIFLKLAEVLSLAGLHVTYLNSEYFHQRLLRYSDVQTRFARYPGFRFETITDGLPPDHPRSGEKTIELNHAIEAVTKPLFRELLVSGRLIPEDRPPLTCLIADGVFGFAIDAAKEVGIMAILFRPVSACSIWACFNFPEVLEAGELPLKGCDAMDEHVTSVPGMNGFLRRRDLPGFSRVPESSDPGFQLVMRESRRAALADALILNTFEDLEGPVLDHLRSHIPNLYTVGPLHEHLKSRLPEETTSSLSTNNLWEVDRNCVTWLDAKPSKSVIYVSFGSVAVVTTDQLVEFWHGLVNSKKFFLWVMRPDSVIGKDWENQIPAELSDGTKERGYIVGWSPQEQVLTHPAIGGFLTHSGWNSTLESIVAGVPMICWPYFADQLTNSRYVGYVWKLGIDMKDTCDRATIEKVVNELMEVRKDEFIQSAEKMAKLAKKAVSEGGSSYCNFDRLINDIKLAAQKKIGSIKNE